MASSSALLLLAISSLTSMASAGNLFKDLDITWGDGRGKILNGGHLLTLSLDKSSGSGFQSRSQYLFGRIDMQIKLVAGNSPGTVTTYYMRSPGWLHDEIDFEFLGNLSGHPYTLHTNIFTLGKGGREQQFRLWFDPARHFHTYSILWNPRHVILLVDDVPIRDFRSLGSRRAGFPAGRPMRVCASLWNADDWATQGGRVKTDWRRAPFTASFRNFSANGCVAGCFAGLDPASQKKLRWVRTNYMIYNYCDDRKRFPKGPPAECYV